MTIILNNLKRVFRSKLSIIITFVMPIVLMVLQIQAVSSSTKATVGVVWEESTAYTQVFRTCLESQYDVVDLDRESVSKEVINMHVDCAFIVHNGMTKEIIDGKEPAVEFFLLQEGNVSIPMKNYIASFLEASNVLGKASGGDEQLFYKGLDEYISGKMKLEYKKFESSAKDLFIATRSIGFLALGLMFFMSIATSTILKDKQMNVYDRIITTPVTPANYTISNLISYAILSLIQIGILFLCMVYALKVNFGENVLSIVLTCFVFSISNMSIGILIGSLCKNMAQVNAMMSLINVPLLMIGGCVIPVKFMPKAFQSISKFLPTNWFMVAVDGLLNGKGLSDVYPKLLFLLGFAAVVTCITFTIRKLTKS